MYRKKGREWTKHVDFMLLDILCIQLAFIAAYIFRFGISNPYMDKDYRILGIAFLFIDFVVEIVADSFKNVLKRGYFDEFISTCKHVILVEVVTTFYLFTTQMGGYLFKDILLHHGSVLYWDLLFGKSDMEKNSQKKGIQFG